jgi:hypothetical protein
MVLIWTMLLRRKTLNIASPLPKGSNESMAVGQLTEVVIMVEVTVEVNNSRLRTMSSSSARERK